MSKASRWSSSHRKTDPSGFWILVQKAIFAGEGLESLGRVFDAGFADREAKPDMAGELEAAAGNQ